MDLELWIFIVTGCLFSCSVGSAVTYYAVNWSRDRQEEEDQARRENAIEHGLKLAQENQQLEQQVSGEHDEIEVEPFMADSGYRRPADGVEFFDSDQLADMREQAAVDSCPGCDGPLTTLDDGSRWCPKCTTFWDPVDIDDEPEHLGQPCGWSDDGTTTCGEPAVGWGYHANSERVWLCDGHYRWACHGADDETAATLPRSLPSGRRID